MATKKTNATATAKPETKPDAPVKQKTGSRGIMQMALVANLLIDHNKNTRKDTAYSKSLEESIKQEGLLQPILVTDRQDGKPGQEVVAGYQRAMACIALGWTQIPSMYIPKMTKEEMLIANLNENAARKNLSSYEEAMGLQRMSEMGMSSVEIARKLGAALKPTGQELNDAGKHWTAGYVANLLRCLKLHPEIVKAWRENHPRISVGWMINGIPAESSMASQALAWEQRKAGGKGYLDKEGNLKEGSPASTGKEGEGENGPVAHKTSAERKTRAEIEAAFETAKEMSKEDESDERLRVVAETLAWVLNRRIGNKSFPEIVGVTDIEEESSEEAA